MRFYYKSRDQKESFPADTSEHCVGSTWENALHLESPPPYPPSKPGSSTDISTTEKRVPPGAKRREKNRTSWWRVASTCLLFVRMIRATVSRAAREARGGHLHPKHTSPQAQATNPSSSSSSCALPRKSSCNLKSDMLMDYADQ